MRLHPEDEGALFCCYSVAIDVHFVFFYEPVKHHSFERVIGKDIVIPFIIRVFMLDKMGAIQYLPQKLINDGVHDDCRIVLSKRVEGSHR